MAYIRVWLHCVWGTKNRYPYLTDEIRSIVYEHIKENARKKSIFLDCINGHFDHVHCLLRLAPRQTIADVVQNLKGESSYWINKTGILKQKFEWAEEYYAVSVSESLVENVRDYIHKQTEKHRKKTWSEECAEFMKLYGFGLQEG